MKNHYLNSLLGEREEIIMGTRQHWFILFREIFVEILICLAIVTAVTLSYIYLLNNLLILLGYFLLILPLLSLAKDVLSWSNHEYIVTNRRVIQIAGLFNKSVVDSSLEKVNDVKMNQTLLGRLFNYGDIEILTASELGVNLFKRIERPIKFKTALLNAKEKLDRGETGPAGDQPANVPALIGQLDVLRQRGILTDEEFQQKKAELLAKL